MDEEVECVLNVNENDVILFPRVAFDEKIEIGSDFGNTLIRTQIAIFLLRSLAEG